MGYEVEVLADSIVNGIRLTTMKVTFPRFILAEVNTHRMLSRNSASSRAISPEKQIERATKDPFIPETFNKRVKGMGVGEAFVDDKARECRNQWLEGLFAAVDVARKLVELDIDKSRVNRILEPYLWHTAIISATEWENFFALRDHPAAQPEFQVVAKMMKGAMAISTPVELLGDQWHLPLISAEELANLYEAREESSGQVLEDIEDHYKKVSAGRIARVSFDTQDDVEPHEKSVERAEMLAKNGHWSPFEHVARPFSGEEWAAVSNAKSQYIDDCKAFGWKIDESFMESFEFCGNFRGWKQMRKEVPSEANFGLTRQKEER